MSEKLVLLNALVTNPYIPMLLKTRPASIDEVKELMRGKSIESYIGHEATARVLSHLLEADVPVSRAMYKPLPGDIAVVARLKKRLEKPEDIKNVSIDDLEFIIVEYYRA
jgi:hypothetical protein